MISRATLQAADINLYAPWAKSGPSRPAPKTGVPTLELTIQKLPFIYLHRWPTGFGRPGNQGI
jgi:hypothetical protein